MKPEVSVIVVSHGDSPWLGECLRSLREQRTGVPHEVIVVLNGSAPVPAPDDPPEVRWIELQRQLHPGEARNAGWRAATGEIVAFLMANCTVLPGWIDAIHEEHRQRPGNPIGGPVRVASGGAALPTAAYFCELVPWFRGETEGYVDDWPICNLSYPRALLESAGGFSNAPGRSDLEFHLHLRASHGIRIWVSSRRAIEFHPIDQLSAFLGREFRQGRLNADLRATRTGLSVVRRTTRALGCWLLPMIFFYRGFRTVRHEPRARRMYLRCAHLLLLGWAARALGDAAGLVRGAGTEEAA
jgi:hypothetical protein